MTTLTISQVFALVSKVGKKINLELNQELLSPYDDYASGLFLIDSVVFNECEILVGLAHELNNFEFGGGDFYTLEQFKLDSLNALLS